MVTVGVQISQKLFSGLESGTDIGFSGSEITNLTKVQGSGYGRLRYGYCRCANQSKMALLAAYKVTAVGLALGLDYGMQGYVRSPY